MHSTVHRTPSARETSSRRCPDSTRQKRPPSVAVTSMICFSRSISAARAAGSGCVKSGEAHIIGASSPRRSRWLP